MNRHQSGCRGKEPELTRTGTDRGYRPAHSQRAPCYTAVWLFYEFFRAGFLAGASSQPIVQVFDLLAIEILAFVAFVLLRPFEGQRLNVIAVYLLGSSKVATAALSVAFDTRYSVPRIPTTVIKIVIIVIQGLLTIAVMVLILIGPISSYMFVLRNRTEIKSRSWNTTRERYFNHMNLSEQGIPQPKPRPISVQYILGQRSQRLHILR